MTVSGWYLHHTIWYNHYNLYLPELADTEPVPSYGVKPLEISRCIFYPLKQCQTITTKLIYWNHAEVACVGNQINIQI